MDGWMDGRTDGWMVRTDTPQAKSQSCCGLMILDLYHAVLHLEEVVGKQVCHAVLHLEVCKNIEVIV
jgi:hypothetical protein